MTGVQTCALPISGKENPTRPGVGRTSTVQWTWDVELLHSLFSPIDVNRILQIPRGHEPFKSCMEPKIVEYSLRKRPEMPEAFDLSTCPLDCGCATDARSSRILFSWQNRAKAPSARFVPLYVMMLCGCPYLRMMSFKNDTAVRPSHFLIGFTSIHLVNLSTITNMWVMLPRAG